MKQKKEKNKQKKTLAIAFHWKQYTQGIKMVIKLEL